MSRETLKNAAKQVKENKKKKKLRDKIDKEWNNLSSLERDLTSYHDFEKKFLPKFSKINKIDKSQKKNNKSYIKKEDKGLYKYISFIFGAIIIIFVFYYIYNQNFSEYAKCLKRGEEQTNFKTSVIQAICAGKYK